MSKSLFFQIKSLTPAQIVEYCEHILADHRTSSKRIDSAVLELIGDTNGNLYTAQLDAIAPYLPGGAKPAFDEVYIGSSFIPWTGSGDMYSTGILNGAYRWSNITLQTKTMQAFIARYPAVPVNFYITYEIVLNQLANTSIRQAYEAYYIESVKQFHQTKHNRKVMVCPAFWQKTPPSGISTHLRVFFENVRYYSALAGATSGMTVCHMQDMQGRNWIAYPPDYSHVKQWFDVVKNAYPWSEMKVSAEHFEEPLYSPAVAAEMTKREGFYAANNMPIGACFEARYWWPIHDQIGAPAVPVIPKIEFLNRTGWGAKTTLPRLGYWVDPKARTEVHVHHTAAIDPDFTPNRWTRAEAISYMRRLQTARPDLGLDIPYTYVFFVLEDLSVLICEGRGMYLSGAHTAGHNTVGVGWAVGGNFDIIDDPARDVFLWAVQNELAYNRATSFPNLGNKKNPKGWWVWGHRDTSNKSCPGNSLYPKLALIDPRVS